MENVDTKNAVEYNYLSYIGKLQVIYKDGSAVVYEDVYGTWGFPTAMKL